MSNLYKRAGSPNWMMRFTDEHGKDIRRSTRTKNHTAAQLMLTEEVRNVELRRAGINAPSAVASREDIGKLALRFEADQLRAGIAPRWAKQQREKLQRLIRERGIRSINELTADLLIDYRDRELAGLAIGTQEKYILAVSSFCKWALQQRPPLIAANPAPHAMPRQTRRQASIRKYQNYRRPLTEHEVPRLLGAEPELAYMRPVWHRFRKPLYTVAMGTGLRRETLEEIVVEMIRLDAPSPFIAIPPELMKSGRPLNMPLADPAVRDAVETLVSHAYARSPKHRKYTGRPFAPVPDVSSTFNADLERAGIPLIDALGYRVDFHSLRQTFGTRLALAGKSIFEVAELMDHASIETTRKLYAQVGLTGNEHRLSGVPSLRLVRDEDENNVPRSVPSV